MKKDKTDISISNNSNYYDVAVIGAIGIHKGSKILEQLITKNALEKIRFHLFGIFDSQYQNSTKNFINHGRYQREELHTKLNNQNIKLICLFSICPETFSYTLSESIAVGIPVLCFDIGALGERVKKDSLGWLLPYDATPKMVIDKINEIFSNPEEYEKIIKNINEYKLKTTTEMALEYNQIYNKVSPRNAKPNSNRIQTLMKNSNNYACNISYSNYAWVFDTLKWKIISKIKIPQPIKKIARKMRRNKRR